MADRPPALTSTQRDIVCAAARSIAPTWRRRFLADIEDQLFGLDAITDDAVNEAIRHALSRMGDAA